MNFLGSEADVGGRNRFRIGSGFDVVRCLNFSPLLRSIIFVDQPPLGEAFDFQRIRLSAVNGRDNLVSVRNEVCSRARLTVPE